MIIFRMVMAMEVFYYARVANSTQESQQHAKRTVIIFREQ